MPIFTENHDSTVENIARILIIPSLAEARYLCVSINAIFSCCTRCCKKEADTSSEKYEEIKIDEVDGMPLDVQNDCLGSEQSINSKDSNADSAFGEDEQLALCEQESAKDDSEVPKSLQQNFASPFCFKASSTSAVTH